MAATQPTLEPDIEPNNSDDATVARASEPRTPPDDRQRPLHQPAGDPAAPHDFAGEDEKRDRQQRKIVETAEQSHMDRGHRPDAHGDDADGCRRDQRDEDRNAKAEQEDRQTDQNQGGHLNRVPTPGRGCL